MPMMTISQVAEEFTVSTRTLRYYEQIGLLRSERKPDYAYRVYGPDAMERLRQILLLRRLRIPLKQIKDLLARHEIGPALDTFRQSLREIDGEIRDLAALRNVLQNLIRRLENVSARQPVPELPGNRELEEIFQTLVAVEHAGEASVQEVPHMSEPRLTDVRILTLPAATVAASHFIGENPEANASEPLDRFVTENRLWEAKPDLRHYGFNHPNPSPDRAEYGYEMWVTIPDGLDVPAPLEKKTFPGGLYAAHMIQFPNFNEWHWLLAWVRDNPEYTFNMAEDGGACMNGLLEEHLNYVLRIQQGVGEENMQLDLLLPIRKKD